MNSHKIGSSQIIDLASMIVAHALTYMTMFYIMMYNYNYLIESELIPASWVQYFFVKELCFFIWERIVAVYKWCVKINLLNGIWKEMVVSLDLTLNRISCEVLSG